MFRANFYSTLKIIESEIVKQNTRFRQAVPAKIKLLTTLRYLGVSFFSCICLKFPRYSAIHIDDVVRNHFDRYY